MKVCDVIQKLQRFPQDADVNNILDNLRNIQVRLTGYEDKDGFSPEFYFAEADSNLPWLNNANWLNERKIVR